MNSLPTKYFIGSTDQLCRLCYSYDETGGHILYNCKSMLPLKTDTIQDMISKCFSLINIIHNITPNIDNLYPDIVIETSKCRIIIDITIEVILPFDEVQNI